MLGSSRVLGRVFIDPEELGKRRKRGQSPEIDARPGAYLAVADRGAFKRFVQLLSQSPTPLLGAKARQFRDVLEVELHGSICQDVKKS